MPAHPTDLPCRHSDHQGKRLYGLSNDSARADKAVLAQRRAAYDGRIRTNRYPSLHVRRPVFILARDRGARVVDIGKDHAGAAEDVVLEGHVVVDRDVVLHLDVVTDDHAVPHEAVLAEGAALPNEGAAADVQSLPDPSAAANSGALVEDFPSHSAYCRL